MFYKLTRGDGFLAENMVSWILLEFCRLIHFGSHCGGPLLNNGYFKKALAAVDGQWSYWTT